MTAEQAGNPLIARVWRGVAATAGDADSYQTHITGRVLPSLDRIPGYRGATVLRRAAGGGFEFIVMTFWSSMDAIQSFAGENVERAVVEPEARAVLIESEETVRHYIVAAGWPPADGPH